MMKKMPVLCKLMENIFMKKILRGYCLHRNLITAILSCKYLAYFLKLSSNMHTLAYVCV